MKLFLASHNRYGQKNEVFLICFTLVLLLFLLGGCGGVRDAITTQSSLGISTIDDAINAIDTSTTQIEQESGAWRDLLPKLINQLGGMESNISADAKGILADTTSQLRDLSTQTIQLSDAKAQDLVAQAGVEFRCNAGFVKAGAVAQLKSIVEDLKIWKTTRQRQVKRPSHAVCWINPSALTLQPSGSDWLVDPANTGEPYIVHVFGYNFWPENLPALELQDSAGQKIRDMVIKPAYVTHYQINLNFSAEKFTDLKPDARVVFRWPDQPDPNSISLVSIRPARLSITGVTFSKSSLIATKDPVWPKVTVKNEGGSPSTPFVVRWQPSPNAPQQSASVNLPLAPGGSILVELPAYTYPICGTFSANIALSNGGASRNETITVAPFCPPVQPVAPDPEKQYKGNYSRSLGPGGAKKDENFGGMCDPGYHRSRVVVSARKDGFGSGDCSFLKWADNDIHMCLATIHLWVDTGSGLECTIRIYEIGDAKPTPTPPPSCSCRP